MECEQLAATVSWQQSALAVGYVAFLDDMNGRVATCVGTGADTQCVVSGLMCSTAFNVWVKALGQQYNSSDSNTTTLTSGTVSIYMDRFTIEGMSQFYCNPTDSCKKFNSLNSKISTSPWCYRINKVH